MPRCLSHNLVAQCTGLCLLVQLGESIQIKGGVFFTLVIRQASNACHEIGLRCRPEVLLNSLCHRMEPRAHCRQLRQLRDSRLMHWRYFRCCPCVVGRQLLLSRLVPCGKSLKA